MTLLKAEEKQEAQREGKMEKFVRSEMQAQNSPNSGEMVEQELE